MKGVKIAWENAKEWLGVFEMYRLKSDTSGVELLYVRTDNVHDCKLLDVPIVNIPIFDIVRIKAPAQCHCCVPALFDSSANTACCCLRNLIISTGEPSDCLVESLQRYGYHARRVEDRDAAQVILLPENLGTQEFLDFFCAVEVE